MSYLLDTNIISELRRKKPNKGVLKWFEKKPASTLFLSVLTLGELRKGIESLTDSNKKIVLIDWLESDLKIFFQAEFYRSMKKSLINGGSSLLMLVVLYQQLIASLEALRLLMK